jgi:membrane protease YdiL (CAAX protease family)
VESREYIVSSQMSDVVNSREESTLPDSTRPPDFQAASQPSYARTLFLGPESLRPGWGLLFYLAMFYALQRVAGAWTASLNPDGLWPILLEELGNLAAAVVPALVLARIETRPWRRYGLPLRQAFGRLFWMGGAWGFGGISLLLIALYGLHVFDFGHLVLHGVRIAKLAAFWAVMFLVVALFEEFLFRGYTQFTLARGISFWPTALVLSVAFGLVHRTNEGEAWPGILAAVFIGLFFCLTLRRTGNLWFAVGFHGAWDWGQTFFYSVPDSGGVFPGHLLSSSFHGPSWLTGGSVGPEGSVLCFVLIGLVWVAFDRMYPSTAQAQASMPLQSTADSSSLRSSE